jgi:hypothetical protein
MKMVLTLMTWCLATASACARLGDTHEQAQDRYGLEKSEGVARNRTPLLEGAKEVTFEHHGWRIRCALLLATDGRHYVVREEYSKIWNGAVMKTGGSPTIKDFECEAVLEGERANQSWRRKVVAKSGNDLASTLGNQIGLHSGLMGTIWVRDDGAIAQIALGRHTISLDLPQALKREAELKIAIDQKARAAVPKF